jgi:hypothetical protein
MKTPSSFRSYVPISGLAEARDAWKLNRDQCAMEIGKDRVGT